MVKVLLLEGGAGKTSGGGLAPAPPNDTVPVR